MTLALHGFQAMLQARPTWVASPHGVQGMSDASLDVHFYEPWFHGCWCAEYYWCIYRILAGCAPCVSVGIATHLSQLC